MKKALKIGGIAVAAAALLLLVTYLCAPWIFTYNSVKKKYPDLEKRIGTFTLTYTDVPADWQTVEKAGLKISAPADFTTDPDSKYTLFKGTDGFSASVVSYGYGSNEDDEDENYAVWTDEFSESELTGFFSKLGFDYKNMTYCEIVDFIIDLNLEQYKKLRGKEQSIFKYFAEMKQNELSVGTTYRFEHNGRKCWLIVFADSKNYTHPYQLIVENGEKSRYITVKGNDQQLVEQCIASIAFTED